MDSSLDTAHSQLTQNIDIYVLYIPINIFPKFEAFRCTQSRAVRGGPHHRFAQFGTLCGKIFITQQRWVGKIQTVIQHVPHILDHHLSLLYIPRYSYTTHVNLHALRWPTSWSDTVFKF